MGYERIKSYQCTVCDKTFATNQGMKSHKRVHNGTADLTCNICQNTFKYTGENDPLNVHCAIKHLKRKNHYMVIKWVMKEYDHTNAQCVIKTLPQSKICTFMKDSIMKQKT